MGKFIYVRINENLEERIKRYSEEKKEDQSDIIRNLINKFGADPSCKDDARQFYCNSNQTYWL